MSQPGLGVWHATLMRSGGLPVYFDMEIKPAGSGGMALVIRNADEQLEAGPLRWQGDSVWFSMSVFESAFSATLAKDGTMQGTWFKGTSAGMQEWTFLAKQGHLNRIPGPPKKALFNISGKWQMQFQRKDGSFRKAIGLFSQQDNRVTGTILNPSGDYRYLEGAMRGDSLYLTAFDGAHFYAFAAKVINDSVISNGRFFGGTPPGDAFSAFKTEAAFLDTNASLPGLRAGAERLDFVFPDLDSNLVSIGDERFKNKVTVVQLMGSWCPNCMDETAFLSSIYRKEPYSDVEIIALAYELSTDFQRSAKSLRKFQQKFGVQYPMLITGARSADPDKATKTLPQLSDIRMFPTTIFIDKQGKVRKVHGGFYGPGAGEYHTAYKKEFFEMLEMLKKE